MKNLLLLFFIFTTSICYSQASSDSFTAAQYDFLAFIVRSNGIEGDDTDKKEAVYETGNVRFAHKYVMKDMEALTVADFRRNVFYGVIKKDGKVSIETKDYTPDIAIRKYDEANMHFPALLKSMLKDKK